MARLIIKRSKGCFTRICHTEFVTQKSRNTQKYFSLYGCLFNRPAEMAEKAEIFSLYGCIRAIREIRVRLINTASARAARGSPKICVIHVICVP